ncbi:hypothetical protein BCEN4_700033 [Burkholderia cenocepacia]|nr:hypothetical protein BCEN4_700033 [Burkholderia cenocepacia]
MPFSRRSPAKGKEHFRRKTLSVDEPEYTISTEVISRYASTFNSDEGTFHSLVVHNFLSV